ncbi:MAG: hypothetical protein ACSHX7_11345 [Luteolibacter sp.]
MGKPSGDEQKPLTRPTETGELAQHSEAVRFFSAGKRGAWVAEVPALMWGDLVDMREPIRLQRDGRQRPS